jgi:hypothetical protein
MAAICFVIIRVSFIGSYLITRRARPRLKRNRVNGLPQPFTKRRTIMKPNKIFTLAIGMICTMFLSVPALYAGDGGVKVGTLVIKTVAGTRHNLLIKSSSDVAATFKGEGGETEEYIGEMGIGFGVDLSLKREETIGYVVFSASSDYKTGSYALQGKYYGADASATLGAGASAKVLVGGFEKSFTLQPLMLGANEGVGAAAGLGYLFLQKK